jgi:hypothetical protein
MSDADVLRRVRETASKRILYLPHAVRQMNRPERMISPAEVVEVLRTGKVIEDYPDDARGHSCLMAGNAAAGRVVHVVCSPKDDYLTVITAYLPDPDQWDHSFETRKKSS